MKTDTLRPAKFFCLDEEGDYLELGTYQDNRVTLFGVEGSSGDSIGVYLNQAQAMELGSRLVGWAQTAPPTRVKLWEDL